MFGCAVQEILEEKYLRESAQQAAAGSVSIAQFRLLKLIALEGEHQVGEVAEFLGVSSPAACKSIDKLEGMGLVERLPSADDRRVTLLIATDRGKRLVRRYEAVKAKRLAPVLERVGQCEVEQLTALMERFSTYLFRSETSGLGYCLRCAAYGDGACTLGASSCPYVRGSPSGEPPRPADQADP